MLIATRRKFAVTPQVREQFRRLSRDQGWFLLIFAFKIALGILAFAWKPWLGIAFLAAYALYVRQEMKGHPDEEEVELEPLKLQPRRAEPHTAMAALQTLLALVVIFGASRLFVAQLAALGPSLGLRPQLLALLLSPIATELPETMNAIIWVRQGKHRLALANISGAMMIQATVPTALGLFFTPWLLDRDLLVGAAVTAIAIAILLLGFRRATISPRLLAAMGLLYVAFIFLVAVLRAPG